MIITQLYNKEDKAVEKVQESTTAILMRNGRTIACGTREYIFGIARHSNKWDMIRVYYPHNYVADEIYTPVAAAPTMWLLQHGLFDVDNGRII